MEKNGGEERGLKEGKKEGKREGKKEGKAQLILLFLQAKYGDLPTELRRLVAKLSSAKADHRVAHLPQCDTLADVQAWLDTNA